jgi:hypothetical protein
VAQAGIDVNFTLADKAVTMIFAGGLDTAPAFRCEGGTAHQWSFRAVGGPSWILLTTTSTPLDNNDAGTNLANDTILADANRRCNAGGSFVESGKEFEADVDGVLNIDSRVRNGEVSEAQTSVRFNAAVDDTQYEFSCEWTEKTDGLTRVVYTARVSTPAVGGGSLIYRPSTVDKVLIAR